MIDIKHVISSAFAGWGQVHDVDGFVETTRATLARRGFTPDNSHLIYSVCPDEICRLRCRKTVELALQGVFDGEFHLGNLAAYPIGGITGITAASHHVPDRMEGDRVVEEGNLIFFVSPHVGVTVEDVDAGSIIYGKVKRPGQEHLSTCCGAMMAFLGTARSLLDGTAVPGQGANRLDLAKGILFSELVDKHKDDIQALLDIPTSNEQVISLAKINYELVSSVIKDEITTFFELDPFHGHFALVGGITVNAPGQDYFVLKETTFYH